jgi:hypothetical protein
MWSSAAGPGHTRAFTGTGTLNGAQTGCETGGVPQRLGSAYGFGGAHGLAFRTTPGLAAATYWFRSAQGLEARSKLAGSAQRLDVLDMGRDRAGPPATMV